MQLPTIRRNDYLIRPWNGDDARSLVNHANNPSSMRVLEKNGFHQEAIHKRAVMKEGELLDEHLFALLKDTWKLKVPS